MTGYKKEITLNEKDSLTDILLLEKQIVKLYAEAMTEGASKNFRNLVKSNLDGEMGDQYTVYKEMSKNGYYETKPADKMTIDTSKQKFSEELKQMAN